MAWLTVRTNDGLDAISSEDLKEFEFEDVRVPLIDAQRGIRKPAQLDAALSIRTVYRPEGASRPYEDSAGPDGLMRYKWRGLDGDHPENRALRAAMSERLPMIWFSASALASTNRSTRSSSSRRSGRTTSSSSVTRARLGYPHRAVSSRRTFAGTSSARRSSACTSRCSVQR